jgi:MerR family redox-sensitive transcriptional activator SoxR
MDSSDLMTIGQVAERAGLATSTLRFYEAEGLIDSQRTAGNQRRYARAELRRIALIRAAQSFGLTLADIRDALESLPDGRTPTKRDWERLAGSWRLLIDERIEALERLRDEAASCIGCGCLSLRSCALYNAADMASHRGAGPRYLMGDDRGE